MLPPALQDEDVMRSRLREWKQQDLSKVMPPQPLADATPPTPHPFCPFAARVEAAGPVPGATRPLSRRILPLPWATLSAAPRDMRSQWRGACLSWWLELVLTR